MNAFTDITIFIFFVIMSLIFALLPFVIGGHKVLAVFPFIGGVAGMYGLSGLLVDGSLTIGNSVVATSGAVNSFIWTGLSLFAVMLVITDFLIVAWVALR